jgi:hypothetical protein
MNKMKKLLIGMIGLAAMTGGAFAANIMFDLGQDYNFSDQGSAAANGDNVYIRGGANVVLDQNTPNLNTVYLSHTTGNGTLTMDSAYSMTATTIWAGHQTQAATKLGTVNQSAGILSVTTLNVGNGTGSGEYNMSGGELTGSTGAMTVGANGAFNMSGGILTSSSASTTATRFSVKSGGSFDISGGTFADDGRLSVRGTFTITGNDATINLHQMSGAANSGTFEFAFDSDGVSTIASDSWLDFSNASLSINKADYAGGAGDFVLVDAGNSLLNGGFGAGNISVDGFGEEGVDWNLTQDFVANTVTFTVVPEPGTYALLGGLLALGYVMVRRRR